MRPHQACMTDGTLTQLIFLPCNRRFRITVEYLHGNKCANTISTKLWFCMPLTIYYIYTSIRSIVSGAAAGSNDTAVSSKAQELVSGGKINIRSIQDQYKINTLYLGVEADQPISTTTHLRVNRIFQKPSGISDCPICHQALDLPPCFQFHCVHWILFMRNQNSLRWDDFCSSHLWRCDQQTQSAFKS